MHFGTRGTFSPKRKLSSLQFINSLPRLFNGLPGCQVLHDIRRHSEPQQDNGDEKVVKVLLEQIERLGRSHSRYEHIQAMCNHQAGALEATWSCIDATDSCNRLIVVDDLLTRQWQLRNVRNDALLAGLVLCRRHRTSRIQQSPRHLYNGSR